MKNLNRVLAATGLAVMLAATGCSSEEMRVRERNAARNLTNSANRAYNRNYNNNYGYGYDSDLYNDYDYTTDFNNYNLHTNDNNVYKRNSNGALTNRNNQITGYSYDNSWNTVAGNVEGDTIS